MVLVVTDAQIFFNVLKTTLISALDMPATMTHLSPEQLKAILHKEGDARRVNRRVLNAQADLHGPELVNTRLRTFVGLQKCCTADVARIIVDFAFPLPALSQPDIWCNMLQAQRTMVQECVAERKETGGVQEQSKATLLAWMREVIAHPFCRHIRI